MVSLEQAKKIATKKQPNFSEFDSWYEYPEAYVFSVSTSEDIGGFRSPFLVMKSDGEIRYTFPQMMMNDELGEEIKSGKI